MPQPGRLDRRGFTIFEMLLIFPLITMTAILCARFGGTVIHAMMAARQEATNSANFENTTTMLRRDVWQAAEIQAITPHELLLTGANHQSIRWKLDADRHLRQTIASGQPRDWGLQTTSMEFTRDGPVIHVKRTPDDILHATDYCLVNALMLTRETNR